MKKKTKECRCWVDYPNPARENHCQYYECVQKRKMGKGRRTKTVCKLKEENNG